MSTVLMAEVDDSVPGVLSHGVAGTELRPMLDHQITGTDVLVLEPARLTLGEGRRKKE